MVSNLTEGELHVFGLYRWLGLTLLVELSKVNLIVGWDWFRYCMNWSNSNGGPGHIHSMSSMYLFQNRGFVG